MERWRELHGQRKEVRQRHKRHQRDMERGRGTIDARQFADDEALLGEEEPEKPRAPGDFPGAATRERMEKAAALARYGRRFFSFFGLFLYFFISILKFDVWRLILSMYTGARHHYRTNNL